MPKMSLLKLFNKQVTVVVDPNEDDNIPGTDTREFTGVVITVGMGLNEGEIVACCVVKNTTCLAVSQIGDRLFIYSIGGRSVSVSIISLSIQTPLPQPMIGQFNVFYLWKKRVFVSGKLGKSEGIVTNIVCEREQINDSESKPLFSIDVLCDKNILFLRSDDITSLVLPDERNLLLLNKRFKRVMSLDALSVVAKYLIE